MARAPSSGVTSRHALNVMLLHACHFLRMARATTRNADGTTVYGWEVALDRAASVREAEHALAALSLACRLSARSGDVSTRRIPCPEIPHAPRLVLVEVDPLFLQ